MRILLVRRYSIKRAVILSIAVVVLNLLTLRYLVADDIENTNLASLAGKCVAIDPGHGGIDGGASSNGVTEKDVTLAVAAKVAGILQANGAKVVMTRDSDIDYYTRGKGGKRNDLLKRVDIIESSGADAFVSIHCNAIRGAQLSGAQVFYSPRLEENKLLAEIMQRALKNFPPGNKRQAKQDSNILLLNATNIAGVLVETGYLTNKKEAALLTEDDYQTQIAEHIVKALAYHFSQNAGR